MDIDIIEEAQAAGQPTQAFRKHIVAPVDDAHPFDLEGYISNYTGRYSSTLTRYLGTFASR